MESERTGLFAGPTHVRPLHFLVTDDDLDKRLLIGMALSKTFPTASVFECWSGKEALESVPRRAGFVGDWKTGDGTLAASWHAPRREITHGVSLIEPPVRRHLEFPEIPGSPGRTSSGMLPAALLIRYRSVVEFSQFRFLVVDDNSDSRQLLVKTLGRKYPEAVMHECRQGDAAIAIAKRSDLTAIISHRTYDYDGETLVALFRRVNATVPIVMVSGYDRADRAKAAGADAFLNYDRWLMIGTVVNELIAAKSAQASSEAGAASAPLMCFSTTLPIRSHSS